MFIFGLINRIVSMKISAYITYIRLNWRTLLKRYFKRYVWPPPRFWREREAVVMVDGTKWHGGLTDRFRIILSVYSYCKAKGIRFRLYYRFPNSLTEYLSHNEYDWRISPGEITYNFLDSKNIYLYVKVMPELEKYRAYPGVGQPISPERLQLAREQNRTVNNNLHLSALDREFAKKRHRQYHIYGNSFFAHGHFKPLFEELFRPSEYLESKLKAFHETHSEPYESVTLRFQMLLGDCKEGSFEVLDQRQQEGLIDKCSKKIEELWRNNYFSTPKILVTSDSWRFLSFISQKEYVYAVPGRMEHMDFTRNPDVEMNSKPFLDLFLLMRSKRLTQLLTGKMYRSGFPVFAAELGEKPYNEIVF